jgi:hypothetical protein
MGAGQEALELGSDLSRLLDRLGRLQVPGERLIVGDRRRAGRGQIHPRG